MQACVYEEYGPADVVKVQLVERPRIGPNEALVRVHAASVTTADWRLRSSTFPPIFWVPGRLMLGIFRPRNRVLGMDFSGVVEAAGSEVTRLRVGEHVFGSSSAMRRGAHAEYVVVRDSDAVLPKPPKITDEQAAAIPFGANTALAFLGKIAPVRRGERVLVVGASGSVGVWAVQLARYFGAHVTGVCSRPNVELVRELGAHEVVDYTATPNVPPRGERYDIIFDTVGVTDFGGCKAALTERGVYLPLNGGVREILQALLTGPRKGKRLKFAISENTRESLTTIVNLIGSGALRPVVDRVYPMQDIAEAHRHVERRHKRGSVIVSMSRSNP